MQAKGCFVLNESMGCGYDLSCLCGQKEENQFHFNFQHHMVNLGDTNPKKNDVDKRFGTREQHAHHTSHIEDQGRFVCLFVFHNVLFNL